MSVAIIKTDRYTVDPLYQWDLNQVLEIRGLSLPSIPEIHFTTDAMDRAIVRQASMDAAGVITVDVPNALLQKPYTIKAYICVYEGETFRSLYMVTIPVKARKRPTDYTFEDTDGEIYSFNALENLVNNTIVTLTNNNTQAVEDCRSLTTQAVNAFDAHSKQTDNPHKLTADQLGAAPAGFGLGGANEPIVRRLTADDDINTVVENGWYWWAEAPENAPMTYCAMRTWAGLGEYFVQEIITGNIYHDNVIMRRYTKTGTAGWCPWEYVNPPMIIDEEYRTTERWNDEPVYRKAITYRSPGTISGDFVVPHGIPNFRMLIGCFATANRTAILPYISGDYMTRVKEVNSEGIHLANNNPYFNENNTFYFDLAYTKADG